jgi:O-glycosyl hydrolase
LATACSDSGNDLADCAVEAGKGCEPDRSVVATVSTEYNPMDARWFSDPWDASEIPNPWSPVSTITPISGDPVGPVIQVDPAQRYQQILGLGASLEHTTVYALQKNKDRAQQKDVLRALIDRDQGLGLNLFRLTIGTSDFADGTRAVPPPADPKGWYTLQDTPDAPFSIERDRSLGIVEVASLALEVAAETGTDIRFFASAWSPPAWMREGGQLVQGGPLKEDMLDDYAAYLRAFIETYQAEGIPIYAITMQNERQFEPATYPGMIISWEMERDLLIEVYENFHNISGDYGDVLDVKLWTLDHNFDLWEQAREQITSLKSLGKADYLDATAFHHYGGDPESMGNLHQAHPDKDIIFTEGTVWGLNADGNRRGYETLLRHFRNWSTGYVSWVTMSTQTLDEANQGPYNRLGALDPTVLVKTDGDNPDWYKTPEYWVLGQFSKFIHPGAVRIASDYGSLDTVTTVAFENADGEIVLIVANSTDVEQPFSVLAGETSFSSAIAPKSLATYRW